MPKYRPTWDCPTKVIFHPDRVGFSRSRVAECELKMRSIACPMVRAEPPAPNCRERFSLVSATIDHSEIDAGTTGILVLGFQQTADGPILLAHGVRKGPSGFT